ncbi:MAG: hypothetical protein LBT00_02615 [Spirochaetaceae bacterium]|nr:hypothetical protein [Spirochaetaceae bacterium]
MSLRGAKRRSNPVKKGPQIAPCTAILITRIFVPKTLLEPVQNLFKAC